MKAMEKDRTRRYETANGLAEDIEHHLNNEPVVARPARHALPVPEAGATEQGGLCRSRGRGSGACARSVPKHLAGRSRRHEAEQAQSHLRQASCEAKELAMRQLAYASDMSLAQQALAMNDLGRARQLLEDHRPRRGEVDLRGWEWRYLWQECRSDALGELCRYPNSAYSVAYSPDGRLLAVAGSNQEFVEIWDVSERKRIAILQPNEGSLVAFSPRGDLLATDAGKQIRLWRTGTWDLVRQLALPDGDEALVLKFSPDGTRLACISCSNKVHQVVVWEVDRWTIVNRIGGVRFLSFWSAMDFSPDAKALAIGDANHRLQVVDLTDGSVDVNIPEAHPEGITAVAWSPKGSIIASGSGFSGGPIRLWDAVSGNLLGVLEGHTSWICELIFSPNGRRLYSSSGDQTIRIWEVEPAAARGHPAGQRPRNLWPGALAGRRHAGERL